MSIIAEIFSGGASGVFKGVKDIVSTFKADPLELAKIELALTQAELNVHLGLQQAQTKINEIEAASQDKFVTRWRPAIGWICGMSLFYSVVGYALLNWCFGMAESLTNTRIPDLPTPDTTMTLEVLLGMLGLGAMRSFEKIKRFH